MMGAILVTCYSSLALWHRAEKDKLARSESYVIPKID